MIVLDASALVDVLTRRPRAHWVLDRLEGEDVVAPAHQPAEALSAVGRLHRSGDLGDETWRSVPGRLDAFRQDLVLPSRAHVERASALSARIRLLDGLYVALAEERACSLVTTDGRLARSQPPCTVLAPRDGG